MEEGGGIILIFFSRFVGSNFLCFYVKIELILDFCKKNSVEDNKPGS